MSSSKMFFHVLQRRLLFLCSSPHSRFFSTSKTTVSSSSATTKTTRRKEKSPSTMAKYLVDSLGFSTKHAISLATKACTLKSEKNANSVIESFKKLGLDDAQIKITVARSPFLLNHDVDETLTPRIRALQDLGLPVSCFRNFLVHDVQYIRKNLKSAILPKVELLKSVLGCGQDLTKALRASKLLVSGNPEHMRGNVMLLQKHGVSSDKIKQFAILFPRGLFYSCELFEESLVKVEQVLGLYPDSTMFVYAVRMMLVYGEEGLRAKFEVFKSYGWTDTDLATLARKLPPVFNFSCNALGNKLNFLMKELGCRPEYILRSPYLLTLSLEKRILPRFSVFRVLKEKKLLKANFEFSTFVKITEARFLDEIVLPYKDILPQIYEAYVAEGRGSLTGART